MMKQTERLQSEQTVNAREWVGDFDYVARNSNGRKKIKHEKRITNKKTKEYEGGGEVGETAAAEWQKKVNEN